MVQPAATTPTIIPCLRYRDALAAIDGLCTAFGFQKYASQKHTFQKHAFQKHTFQKRRFQEHAVYADGDTVHHAQLAFGNGMIMLGSADNSSDNSSERGRQIAQACDIDMRETRRPCVIVTDADAHDAQARAAGATIVMDLRDQDYGGRGYSDRDIAGCRGPEGHLWWFGSYDPWKD